MNKDRQQKHEYMDKYRSVHEDVIFVELLFISSQLECCFARFCIRLSQLNAVEPFSCEGFACQMCGAEAANSYLHCAGEMSTHR